MLSRSVLAMSLLWVLGLSLCAQGQNSQEPESVLEKRMRYDSTRWFFQDWSNQPLLSRLRAAPDDPKPVSEYVREFVTEEQFKVLTEAYNKRLQTHRELSSKMYPFDVLERQARMVSQGRSEELARKAYPVPRGFVDPSPDECRQALLLYIREQDKAEDEWASVVDEVLTPDQFTKFIRYFVFNGKAYLHHPFLQHYLGYSDAQQREIQKQLDIHASLQKKVRREGGNSLENLDVQRAYYKAFAVLTTAQFQKLAPAVGMKQEGESWAQLRARIKKAGGGADEILGPMVDNVIESLKK